MFSAHVFHYLVHATTSCCHQRDDSLGCRGDTNQERRADASVGKERERHSWLAEELEANLACIRQTMQLVIMQLVFMHLVLRN